MSEFWEPEIPAERREPDPQQEKAVAVLRRYFDERRGDVFTSRQIEVQHEADFFHWVTNRAIRVLEAEGLIRSEMRDLDFGGAVKVIWHKNNRYPRRIAARLVQLVEEYSAPNIGGALGLQGEFMVLEGFAREQFVLRGREVRMFGGKKWPDTEHDLDFVFQRDTVVYGVEVKNTLAYMDYQELRAKIALCEFLGIRPVVVARMLPKHWIDELRRKGGFGFILKYQLYPWAHRELARRVREEMGLPVDAPKALAHGTLARFMAWHATNHVQDVN